MPLTSDFYYDLPQELIAQTPVTPRDHSRLLVLNGDKTVEHRRFYNLPEYLRPGDALVVNETKVMPARLFGRTPGGGAAELLLLRRVNHTDWQSLVRPGKRLRPGAEVIISGDLSAVVLDTLPDGERLVRFRFSGVFEHLLDRLGVMPLPPYIKERPADPGRYQTVYARQDGSAAAPTAGLHFTPSLLNTIRAMGVHIVPILLNVGLGTFRPVKERDAADHKMHSEAFEITADAADAVNRVRAAGGRVVCVGTTSVRAVESACANGRLAAVRGETDIFITPGYRFKLTDMLITNFHLPESTLLMLVSALIGRETALDLYGGAVRDGYRFFSFGDAMLLPNLTHVKDGTDDKTG